MGSPLNGDIYSTLIHVGSSIAASSLIFYHVISKPVPLYRMFLFPILETKERHESILFGSTVLVW